MNKLLPGSTRYLLLAALTALLATSCTPSRKAIRAPLKEQGEALLVSELKSNELKFNTLSVKFDAEYEYDRKTTALSGQLRMIRDSVIWLSITPALGIEMARFMLTQDSIKYINRLNNTYMLKGFGFINELLNKTLDYDMAQSLLIGNDFSMYDTSNFKASVDDGQYKLSTLNRRKIKRFVRRGELDMSIPIQSIWLEPLHFKIVKVLLREADKDPRKFTATYSGMENVNEQLMPASLVFEAETAEKKVAIRVNYSKISIDQEITIPFRIPNNYTLIEELGKK